MHEILKQLSIYIYTYKQTSFPSWIFKGIAVLEFKTLRSHLFPLALPRLKFSWVLPWQAPLWRSKPKAWNGVGDLDLDLKKRFFLTMARMWCIHGENLNV